MPNKELYKFDGRIQIEEQNVSLNNDNVLLRGMTLKNTETCFGLVIYSGVQTKIQMNTIKGSYKSSAVMKQVNKNILLIFIM